uniref:Uncharacterized protein n=1 Tax=Nelumbo nucifera TaxID=4432 RepID=A0A822ZI28_NELNU|nr:TPA_asm: hypothetical protein HUJ06_003022 [Nelumbo nucifera]
MDSISKSHFTTGIPRLTLPLSLTQRRGEGGGGRNNCRSISTVQLTFEEPGTGVTIVKLTQMDVPEEDRYGNATVVENTERGWRELIFYKIRAIFGLRL